MPQLNAHVSECTYRPLIGNFPLNAGPFLRYLNQVLPEVSSTFPAGTPAHSVRKSIGNTWKEMTLELKQPYKEAYHVAAAAQKELAIKLSPTAPTTTHQLKRQQQQQIKDLELLQQQQIQDRARLLETELKSREDPIGLSTTRTAKRKRKLLQPGVAVSPTRDNPTSGNMLGIQMIASTFEF